MQFSLLAVLIHGNHSVETLLGELGEALHVVIATRICSVFGSNWAVCFITGGRQNILSLMIAKKYAEYQLAVIFKHQCQRTEKCYCFANMKTRKHFQCSNHSLIKQEK